MNVREGVCVCVGVCVGVCVSDLDFSNHEGQCLAPLLHSAFTVGRFVQFPG